MIFFRTDSNRTMLARQLEYGKLVRLAPGIYSSDTVTEIGSQIRRNLVRIIEYLRPGGLISHSSALLPDMGASSGFVVVTDPGLKGQLSIHDLPGLRVLASPGPGPLPSDTALGPRIHISSKGRAILENLEPARVSRKAGRAKQLSDEEFVELLRKIAPRAEDLEGLKTAADMANQQAGGRWTDEVARLDKVARSLARRLATTRPLHLAGKIDWERIELFNVLSQQLKRGIHGNDRYWGVGLQDFPNSPSLTDRRFENLAFFESYFSNYIEGTEFEPAEAYEIATSQNPNIYDSKDGHDIRSLYALYASNDHLLSPETSSADFLSNLKKWHLVFGEHVTKTGIRPGQFKDRMNRVGSVVFTDPSHVDGTLSMAWEIGQSHADKPFDHAIFRAVSTVSVHPFIDGNGRITRYASSSLLARTGKLHPIIPTVFREDYLLALQAFSGGDPIPAIRMYCMAMQITSSVPFERTFPELVGWLKEKNAFESHNLAKWGGLRPTTRATDQRDRVEIGALAAHPFATQPVSHQANADEEGAAQPQAPAPDSRRHDSPKG